MTNREAKALYREMRYTSSTRYGGWKMQRANIAVQGKFIRVCRASGSGKAL